MKKLLIVMLILIMTFSVIALAEPSNIFPWHDYTLAATLVTSGPVIENAKRQFGIDTVVSVRLTPVSGTIRTEDIQTYAEEFILRDADKNEYKAISFEFSGVTFVDGNFDVAEEQNNFLVSFDIESASPDSLADGRLVVPSDVDGEKYLVRLEIEEPTE